MRIACCVLGIAAVEETLVTGDVELASFGVENCGKFVDISTFGLYVINCVGCNYVERVDWDDIRGVC